MNRVNSANAAFNVLPSRTVFTTPADRHYVDFLAEAQ